jgi:predicted aconitase
MAVMVPTMPTMAVLKAFGGALLATAAVTMAAVNRVQPPYLAEQQHNATTAIAPSRVRECLGSLQR